METKSKSQATCFYLGLLPRSATRTSIFSAFSGHGKVLRLKVARGQADLACKGYGYAWVEPFASPEEFARQCLHLPTPILVFPIQGPKLLGSQNTKTLRRYARVEDINGRFSFPDIISYLQTFGFLALVLREFDSENPMETYRVHALFINDDSVTELSSVQHHFINEHLADIRTFIGLQESPFEEYPNSKTVVTLCELPHIETLKHLYRDLQPSTQTRTLSSHEHYYSSRLQSQIVTPKAGSFCNTSREDLHRGESSIAALKRDANSARLRLQSADVDNADSPELTIKGKPTLTEPLHSSRLLREALCNTLSLSRCSLRRFGPILKNRHNKENLRFNIKL